MTLKNRLFIRNVISSCKNEEQLHCTLSWLERLPLKKEEWKSLVANIELKFVRLPGGVLIW